MSESQGYLFFQRGWSAGERLVRAQYRQVTHWWTRQSRQSQIFLVIILPVLLGSLLRLWHFLAARSLWIDEAYITLNFLERDIGGLMGPLDYLQVAPLGWLALQDFLLSLLGGLERTLRLPAFVVGLVSLAVFPFVARRYVSLFGAFFAVVFFAFSGPMIRYSAEVKPYIFDVLVSLAVLWIGDKVIRERLPMATKQLLLLLLFGLLVIPFSFPAAFLLGSLGGVMIVQSFIERNRQTSIAVCAIAVVWLAEFFFLFVLVQSQQDETIRYMKSLGFDERFAPMIPTSFGDLIWYPKAVFQYFDFIFDFQTVVLAFSIVALGVYEALRRHIWVGFFLILPILIMVFASMIKTYPIEPRLLLFLVPQVILFTAMGIELIAGCLRGNVIRKFVPVFVAVLLLSSMLYRTATQFFPVDLPPYADEHIRPAMEYIDENHEPGDALYVFFAAGPAFKVYENYIDLDDMPIVRGATPRVDWACFFADIERMRQYDRMWVLMSHVTNSSGIDELRAIQFLGQQYGEELVSKRFGRRSRLFGQAQVLLFDFSGDGEAKPPLPIEIPEDMQHQCIPEKTIS